MIGKILQTNELLPALHLVWDVYVSEIAPLQKPEAVAVFQEFIKYQNIRSRVEKRELILFGVYNNQNELCGVSAIDFRGEIRLLYVKKDHQRQGYGRALMQMMVQYCANNLVITRIVIKAFPVSVKVLNHLGMTEVYSVQTEGPEVYVPMECRIAPATMEKKTGNGKTVGIVVGVIAVVLGLIILLGVMLFKETANLIGESEKGDDSTYHSTEDWFDLDEDNEYQFQSSLTQIEAYEESVEYSVEEKSFVFQPDDIRSTKVDFQINYPEISGLDGEISAKINEEFKNCALDTYNRIYEHPSEKLKEHVLSQDNPALLDYVTYKVSYMTDDLLCVMFEDYSYEGSENDSYVSLRSKTVNMKTGEVYELTDIAKMNDEFVEDWIKVMRSEASDDTLLSELSSDEMVMALSGADLYQDTYRPVYFISASGIEIGFSFHYEKEDPNKNGFGWVTAPFSKELFQTYCKKDEFYSLLK